MIFVALAVVVILIFLLYSYHDGQKYPPGPWNLPIIGYLHKLDSISPHLTLAKLAQKYGPIFRVKFGLINIVMVAEAKLAKKILIKDETLGRPDFFMLHVMFRGKDFFRTPVFFTLGLIYSPLNVWKDQRKFTSNFLSIAGATKFSSNRKDLEDMISNYADDFVHHVRTQGDRVALNPSEALMHYVSSIAGTLILGKCFSRDDNVRKNLMHHIDIILHSAQLGGPLNYLPLLRFLPKYKKTLSTFSDTMDKIRKILSGYITEYEKTYFNDDSASNFIEAFLLQRSKGGPSEIYNDDQLIYLLFDVFTASTETTFTSLRWTVLYLAQHQKVQDKVRQELLDVLYGKELKMSDLPELPYTQATITEIARIRAIVPLGFPHYAAEDIYIDDIKIGKGTTIMPSIWAIHMDPKVWDKPEEFRPERFLDEDNKFTPSELVLPFQCGKRMCVGDEFARLIIYLFIGTLLKNFKIEPCESKPIDLSEVCGLTLTPKPQEVVFVKI